VGDAGISSRWASGSNISGGFFFPQKKEGKKKKIKREDKKGGQCGMAMYYPLPHISYPQIKQLFQVVEKKRETMDKNPPPFPSCLAPQVCQMPKFPETP